jgi:steroid delta-isomerase-like uncharacterized protein
MSSHHTADENKALVHRFIQECWNQGESASVPAVVAPDVHLHDSVFPLLPRGAQALRRHLDTCRRAFPDIHFTVNDTIAERNEVVVHWTCRGTHDGEFLGMPPTHKQAVITGTSIYRLDGQRIAEEWVHWNLLSLTGQLGIPQPPGSQNTPEFQNGTPQH